jgi:hypothetical protein
MLFEIVPILIKGSIPTAGNNNNNNKAKCKPGGILRILAGKKVNRGSRETDPSQVYFG